MGTSHWTLGIGRRSLACAGLKVNKPNSRMQSTVLGHLAVGQPEDVQPNTHNEQMVCTSCPPTGHTATARLSMENMSHVG